jgi:hypothetical protein
MSSAGCFNYLEHLVVHGMLQQARSGSEGLMVVLLVLLLQVLVSCWMVC